MSDISNKTLGSQGLKQGPDSRPNHDFAAHFARIVLPDLRRLAQVLALQVKNDGRSFGSALSELLAEASARGMADLPVAMAGAVEDFCADVLVVFVEGAP